jgi:hypothetical protein
VGGGGGRWGQRWARMMGSTSMPPVNPPIRSDLDGIPGVFLADSYPLPCSRCIDHHDTAIHVPTTSPAQRAAWIWLGSTRYVRRHRRPLHSTLDRYTAPGHVPWSASLRHLWGSGAEHSERSELCEGGSTWDGCQIGNRRWTLKANTTYFVKRLIRPLATM